MANENDRFMGRIPELLAKFGKLYGQPVRLVAFMPQFKADTALLEKWNPVEINGDYVATRGFESGAFNAPHSCPSSPAKYRIETFPEAGKPNGVAINCFSLSRFPGCCGLCISTNVTSQVPGRGFNHIANQIRQEIAYLAGFTVLIATDKTRNEPCIKTLKRQGFSKIMDFVNQRTTNSVDMWVKDLSKHRSY